MAGKTTGLPRSGDHHSGWWHGAVGYCLYIRSFADSDGDGIGDLGGAIAHLDHLEALGVDLVWITPFFASPMADFGYDVSDYCAIDPMYGDMDDLDRLVTDAHARGIRVILDLVPNHTSIKHPWFTQSRTSLTSDFRDHYIWADPGADGGPPNNWVSYFGGPAWTFDDKTGQYYLHLFLPDQPDLNWRNSRVQDEFDQILRFWLNKNIDGFRIDVAQGLVKETRLRSNPTLTPWDPHTTRHEQWDAFEHRYDIGQPETLTLFERWRAICTDYDAVLIGETSVGDATAFAALLPGGGLHVGCWFEPMHIEWNPDQLRRAITEPLAAVADPASIGWMASSLDEDRAATRFGSLNLGRQRALALATVLFCLPGVPFLYQGEELGLVNGVVGADRRADPVGDDVTQSRDGCRTPMPWAPGPTLGFSDAAETWLPTAGRTDDETASVQRSQPDRWFHHYRKLAALRRNTPMLHGSSWEWLTVSNDAVAFRRGPLCVVVNMGATDLVVSLSGTVLFDTHNTVDSPTTRFTLAPAQAVILASDSVES